MIGPLFHAHIAATGTGHIRCHVAADLRQPGGELPGVLQVPEIGQTPREGLLGRVLGKLMIAKDTVCHRDKGGIIALTQRAEAVEVSGLRGLNQFRLRIDLLHS